MKFIKINNLPEFNYKSGIDGKFDLALSSEVFQRIDKGKETYISNLIKVANNFAIFAPNRGNESHASLSGLNSVSLEELLIYCQAHSKATLYDYGYIDMPPFPPGISRSQDKREKASRSRIESFLMKGLEIYNLSEDIIPTFIKRQIAHIVYVMAINP